MPIPERAHLSLVKEKLSFEVHFNPASLQYTITNTLKEGRSKKTKQHVSQSTGKLSMELVFDTTDTGKDVRIHTNKVAALMEPKARGKKKYPVVAKFEWGAYAFQGMVESYQETIDFFASNGVPLRASIKLTLAQQDAVFQSKCEPKADKKREDDVTAVRTPGAGSSGGGDVAPANPSSATQIAGQAGDTRAGRQIAAANGIENPRRIAPGASIVVSEGVQTGATAGLSGQGGFSGGVSVAGSVGASASAGVSASGGAFAGLRANKSTDAKTCGSLDASALLPEPAPISLGGGQGGGVGIGGQVSVGNGVRLGAQASLGGSASLCADVGLSVSLRDRIQFDGE